MQSLSTTIADMKAQQARMRADRKRLAQQLKNAQKRKSRLRTKARQLSNEDLLAVLLLRQEQGADAPRAEPGAATGSASSSGASAPDGALADE